MLPAKKELLVPIVTVPQTYFQKIFVIVVGFYEMFWILWRPNRGIMNSSLIFETGETATLEITVWIFEANYHSHNLLLEFAEW